MKVNQDFIDSLWFKGGWNLETINDKTYHVIHNPVYCKLFWTQYWKEVLVVKFKNQSNIDRIHEGDLTTKVIIDADTGNVLAAPTDGRPSITSETINIKRRSWEIILPAICYCFYISF